MSKYKIMEKGRENKVLVEWDRGYNKEYSVHTLSLNDELIWGHYYTDEDSARRYFNQYKL